MTGHRPTQPPMECTECARESVAAMWLGGRRVGECTHDTATDRWMIGVPLVVVGTRGSSPLTMNHVRAWHWAKVNRHTKQIRESVAWRTKAAKIPPQAHITVGLHYSPGDDRVLDPANLQASQKAAVDGLVDAGVVSGDDDRYVTEVSPVVHGPDGWAHLARRLWLEIASAGPATPADTYEPVHGPAGGRDDTTQHDETRTR